MMNQTTIIQNLLQQVTLINKKYEEIAKVTGENFNVFSVLRLESDEVRLHNRFIGELLSPNGRHDQGAEFLKLFVKTLPLNDYSDEQLDSATVIIEKNIGNISDDYEKGGRIDLVISPKGNEKVIVIENKIYAPDQIKQLWRYHNEYKKSNLLYLTLEKRSPSPESLGGMGEDRIVNITYKEHIRKWLEQCLKETVGHPLLRETISQYLNLIKSLTGQATNIKMEKEIIDLITATGDNFNSTIEIFGVINEAKKKLMNDFSEIFKSTYNKNEHNGFKMTFDEKGFYFRNEKFKDEKFEYHLEICFEGNYPEAFIGIYSIRKPDQNVQNKFKEILAEVDFWKQVVFPNWVWVRRYTRFNNNQIWKDIADKNTENIIEDITKEVDTILVKIAKAMDL